MDKEHCQFDLIGLGSQDAGAFLEQWTHEDSNHLRLGTSSRRKCAALILKDMLAMAFGVV
eukprot:469863-Amphidinium_carterae.2